MNFTFIPSPEKAKKFTAVEDAKERIAPLKLGDVGKWGVGKWGQAPFSPFMRQLYESRSCLLLYEQI